MSKTNTREGEAPAEPGSSERRLPVRKHPSHGVVAVPGQPTIILLTVCTQHRERWLTSDDTHLVLREVWQASTAWLVGRYVIMQDHIHLFAGPGDQQVSLEGWVRYWKSLFTKRHGNRNHRWQVDHWDKRIRSAELYRRKWEYVRGNPVRHRLVESAQDWPYQGQVYRLGWDEDA